MVLTAVLDTNAVDHLLDAPDLNLQVVSAVEGGKLRLLYTHVTVDEVARVPDAARRAGLLSLLTAFAEAVPTGDFVVGTSRVGMARLSGENSPIDALRSPTGGHTFDALIAGTALYEGAQLVTYERRLTNRATAAGITVVTWPGLLAQLPSE
jgi:predicted nucleic acid-binding protein